VCVQFWVADGFPQFFFWQVLSDAYSDRYKSFINSEVLKANTKFAEENENYPECSTSFSNLNAHHNSSGAFMHGRSNTSLPSSMNQVAESVKSTMTSTRISDGALEQGLHIREQVHKLSFQIIGHANTLRSIMGTHVLGKTGAASARVDADWNGSDQVRFDSSTILVNSNYELSPEKRTHYDFE
jgi:hypothetical protein